MNFRPERLNDRARFQKSLISVIHEFETGNYSLYKIWKAYPGDYYIEAFTELLFDLGLIYFENGVFQLSEQGRSSLSHILKKSTVSETTSHICENCVFAKKYFDGEYPSEPCPISSVEG